ncbi:MAG: exodeoxyribonuclease VII small subunit [Bacteroidetes bacterium]|nr:exodeoxyribonuclease VII small subunit [Bacteroidota bacterium]MBU1421581.1 exodeoxyribonuclease VII small subunit [Bacteroidota bacterium]MBU2471031.1 exodeoxyribonuclease VII small subunit [Bacteroidota bacterium]MBU2635585.1 exodeoxyribonuclease VII small subunit [Bacteroidota bacterium]MDI6779189.1 exodeoxyribonuclease VII small subunit [Bacteroidota bacterium]
MVKKNIEKKESVQTFEQSFKRLEKIVDILERGEVSLEESIKMYEEGIELSKVCLDKLTEAELKIKKLSKDVNGKLALTEEDEE